MKDELEKYIAENDALKCELEVAIERFHKAEKENQLLQKKIDDLEKMQSFHLGQIEAYRFALKGGAE